MTKSPTPRRRRAGKIDRIVDEKAVGTAHSVTGGDVCCSAFRDDERLLPQLLNLRDVAGERENDGRMGFEFLHRLPRRDRAFGDGFWAPSGGAILERLDFNDPPIAIGGIQGKAAASCRLDFNDPPIAIGGIPEPHSA